MEGFRDQSSDAIRNIRETVYRWVFTILAFASLVFLIGIILTLFRESLPIFTQYNIFQLIFGTSWYPTYSPPEFGMLPLILASFLVTFGALVVCVPIGIGTALFLHELATDSQRAVLKPVIEILAGIPSIIYGFFGMAVVAPFSRMRSEYLPASMPSPPPWYWASWRHRP